MKKKCEKIKCSFLFIMATMPDKKILYHFAVWISQQNLTLALMLYVCMHTKYMDRVGAVVCKSFLRKYDIDQTKSLYRHFFHSFGLRMTFVYAFGTRSNWKLIEYVVVYAIKAISFEWTIQRFKVIWLLSKLTSFCTLFLDCSSKQSVNKIAWKAIFWYELKEKRTTKQIFRLIIEQLTSIRTQVMIHLKMVRFFCLFAFKSVDMKWLQFHLKTHCATVFKHISINWNRLCKRYALADW